MHMSLRKHLSFLSVSLFEDYLTAERKESFVQVSSHKCIHTCIENCLKILYKIYVLLGCTVVLLSVFL